MIFSTSLSRKPQLSSRSALRDIFEAAIADRARLVVSELDDAQPEAVEHLQPLGPRRVDVRAALHQPPARIRIGAETRQKAKPSMVCSKSSMGERSVTFAAATLPPAANADRHPSGTPARL